MSMRWNCCAYKNGKPDTFTSVVANSKAEAEQMAWEKFRKMGIKPERVTVS